MDEPTLQDLLVDISVLDRADIPALLEARTIRGSEYFRRAFMDAAAAVEQTDLPLSRFYKLLAIAFDPPLRTEKAPDPFGPLMMFRDGSLRDLSSAHLDLLQAAPGKDSNPAFKARLADILWTYKHGTGTPVALRAGMPRGTRCDPEELSHPPRQVEGGNVGPPSWKASCGLRRSVLNLLWFGQRIAAWRAGRRNNRQARRGSDGKLCSPDAIIAPPLDGKRKYTQIIVSGRSALPGIGVVL